MNSYDAIIIGAGHNGLVCATTLAQAGRSVLVLEASSGIGGLAAKTEFHPGFFASPAHSVTHFSQKVAKSLGLESHGLAYAPMSTTGLSADGQHVSFKGDHVEGVGAADQAAFKSYRALMTRFARVMDAAWGQSLSGVDGIGLDGLMSYARIGLKLKLLGQQDMGEFLRIFTLPMRDLMGEYFESDVLQAALSWDALIGSKAAPRSPNNAVLPLLLRMSGASRGDHLIPVGGVQALVSALEASARSAGVEIRTEAEVQRIIVNGDENGLMVNGVELANGEVISSSLVVSSADPKRTFFDLIGAKNLDIEFTNRISRLRSNGFVAKFHVALSELPDFTGLKDLDGRFIIAPDLDSIEFAYDDAKYGEASENPVIEFTVPSLHDTTLAPDGQHVLSAHVMYAPYLEESGWSEPAREAFEARILNVFERFAPGFDERIVHHQLLTPLDLERDYNLTGGHWHHAELALDQMMMMRPTYGAAQHQTPIPGIYICGAGCHPGGGLMGSPGYNAARQILK
jgi:phytoene dehydrogenase-like protein